jgi:hypothetical protein
MKKMKKMKYKKDRVYRPDDVGYMVAVARRQEYIVDPIDMELAWADHSDNYSTSWLRVYYDGCFDHEIISVIERYFEEVEE